MEDCRFFWLKDLIQIFSKAQINLKQLDIMSKVWEAKTTSIAKAYNLKKKTLVR